MPKKDSTHCDTTNDTPKEETGLTGERDKLLMHIHEQFAVNNNSNLNTLITLFIALLAVLGSYGYTVIKIFDNGSVSCASLTFVSIVSFAVLTIIAFINIFQGYKFRSEQIIIDNIRFFYKLDEVTYDGKKVIPWEGKGKNLFDYCPGLYGLFLRIIVIIMWLLCAVSVYAFCNYKFLEDDCATKLGNVLFTTGAFIVCLLLVISYWRYCYYKKYKDKEKENDKENDKDKNKKEQNKKSNQ